MNTLNRRDFIKTTKAVFGAAALPFPGMLSSFSKRVSEDSRSNYETRNLINYVNMRWSVERPGNCVIGPQMPFGSINPSPDTSGNPMTDGYDGKGKIRGFSQTHVSGTGGATRYGNFLVSPQIGLSVKLEEHESDKSEEVAKVGYYKTRLDKYNILCEFAPTKHASIYRFTFPKSNQSSILIDVSHYLPKTLFNRTGITRGEVNVDEKTNTIAGWGEYEGGWAQFGEFMHNYKIYFSAEVSKTPDFYGTWKNSELFKESKNASVHSPENSLGGYFTWNTEDEEIIYMKIAVSMVSIERANEFLQSEIRGWEFEKVRKNCEDEWNKTLSSILIDDNTATQEQLTIFYSAFYRCFMMPRDRTGDCPHGWDTPYYDDQYCGWDTFRSHFPLIGLVKESFIRENISSYLSRFHHKKGENYISDAFIAGYNTFMQGGDNVDPVISEAYAKKVEGIDWEQAYKILKNHAENHRSAYFDQNDVPAYRNMGWIPASENRSSSLTMEYAYNDFCIALVAAGMGKAEDFKKYYNRSNQWVNTFNAEKECEGYYGFLQPRNEDLSWVDADPKKHPADSAYEGSLWGYSYYVPHNIELLKEKMGGNDLFVSSLVYYFENGLHNWSNEPCFLTTRLFNFAGRPDLTSKYTRQGMNLFDINNSPGNEDSGGMGSWYVLSSIGLFPLAGTDIWLINGPVFKNITLQMENGGKIFINAPKAGHDKNLYVGSLKINGKTHDQCWFRHNEIKKGAELTFTMSETPTKWGAETMAPSGKDIL